MHFEGGVVLQAPPSIQTYYTVKNL